MSPLNGENMKNRQAIFFLVRFSLAIFIAIVILIAAGFIAYRGLNKLVATIAAEGKPNVTLNLLKDVQYDLTDAELNARSYSLTGDEETIQAFYANVESSFKRIKELKRLNRNNPLQVKRLDEIGALVMEKKEIMQELITLKEDSAAAIYQLQRFKSGLNQLKDTASDPKPTAPADKEEKKPFLKKLFGKKEKRTDNELEVISPSAKRNNYLIARISQQLDSLTRKQREAIVKKELQELNMIERDKLISYNIRQLIEKINRDEYRSSLIIAKNSEESATSATILIFIFSMLTVAALIVSSIIVFSYIKTNQRYRKVLSESKNRAEHLARLRLEFLSNMSHEIRTPLNAIVGFSEQLGKKDLSPDQQQSVRIIKESSEHLSGLISDVLDHAKMESGKFTLEKIPFKPMQVFQQVFDFYRYEAYKKGLQLSLLYINNIPEYIVGDPMRLKQVLINLMSNSMKFTSKGFIKMEVKSVEKSIDKIMLDIKISDSGIGIAPEKQKFIFDEYTQAETNITRKYGGTGLGLSISKKLVEIQGGSIALHSEVNNGTVFELHLPFELNLNALVLPQADIFFSNPAELKKFNILAADDENYNRLLLSHIFEKWGVEVDFAVDGLEVLDKLSVEDYDLILMDVKMPYLDGLEATKKIRSGFDAPKKNIPIIAITAGTLSIDRKKCMDAGMNDFITKPFKETELIQVIARTLKLETKEVVMNENGTNNHEDLNLGELREIIGDDNELLKKMIATFIESSEKTMHEIEEAFKHGDYKELTLLAHRLAAPARHMSFNEIADKLKNIEHFEEEKINKPGLNKLINEVKINIAAVNEKLKTRLNLST